MPDERSKQNGSTDSPSGGYSVSIPDELLNEAVKAVDQRVAEGKAPEPAPAVEPEPPAEVSVDFEATVLEHDVNPDDMPVEELLKSGHLPDRVVLAFEEMRARAEQNELEATDAKQRLSATLAESDGFRRRLNREKAEALKFANENLLKEILPIVDNLERALSHAEAGVAVAGGIKEGVEITLRQFFHVLAKVGVTKVDATVGKPFDPHLHEGVTHMDRPDLPDNSIAQVLQPGYLLNDRLIRPAMVAVAKGAPAVVAAKPPAAEETDEARAARMRETGARAREAREAKRQAREARRIEEARESGGDQAATDVATKDADFEAKAKARLERVRAVGAAARAARQAKRDEKTVAAEGGAVPVETSLSGTGAEITTPGSPESAAEAEKKRLEEKLAKIRAAGAAAREARQARRAEAGDDPEVSEPTQPGPDREAEEKLERIRTAGAAARAARAAKRQARADRDVEEAREKGGEAAAAARAKEEADFEAKAQARLDRVRATGAAARAARQAKRDEKAESEVDRALDAVVADAKPAAAKPATPAVTPAAPAPASAPVTAAPAKAAKPANKPSFEDDDLDDWEGTVDAMRTDKPRS